MYCTKPLVYFYVRLIQFSANWRMASAQRKFFSLRVWSQHYIAADIESCKLSIFGVRFGPICRKMSFFGWKERVNNRISKTKNKGFGFCLDMMAMLQDEWIKAWCNGIHQAILPFSSDLVAPLSWNLKKRIRRKIRRAHSYVQLNFHFHFRSLRRHKWTSIHLNAFSKYRLHAFTFCLCRYGDLFKLLFIKCEMLFGLSMAADHINQDRKSNNTNTFTRHAWKHIFPRSTN